MNKINHEYNSVRWWMCICIPHYGWYYRNIIVHVYCGIRQWENAQGVITSRHFIQWITHSPKSDDNVPKFLVWHIILLQCTTTPPLHHNVWYSCAQPSHKHRLMYVVYASLHKFIYGSSMSDVWCICLIMWDRNIHMHGGRSHDIIIDLMCFPHSDDQ